MKGNRSPSIVLFRWHVSLEGVGVWSSNVCEKRRKLQYINPHADVDTFSLMSALSDTDIQEQNMHSSWVQYACVRTCATCCVYMLHMCLCACVILHTEAGWRTQLDAIFWIRTAWVSIGIWFFEVSGLPSNIFYSILLFSGREKRAMGGRGKGGREEYDLSLTLLDESALGD